MPRDFPDVKDGDPIEPYLFNVAFDELRRRRKMRGDGLVVVEDADSASSPPVVSLPFDREFLIRLTGSYGAGYPWEEVQLTPGRGTELTGVTGSVANDPAFERRTGETDLISGSTIYRARRSPASGQVVFPAKLPTSSTTPQPGCPCNPMPSTINGTGNYATTFGPPGRDPTSLGCPTTFILTAQTRPSGFQTAGIVANNTVWMNDRFTYHYYTFNPATGNFDILRTTNGARIIYWCQPQNGHLTCQIYDEDHSYDIGGTDHGPGLYGGVNALLAQTGDANTVHLGCTPFLWQYNATTTTWAGRTNLSA